MIRKVRRCQGWVCRNQDIEQCDREAVNGVHCPDHLGMVAKEWMDKVVDE